LSLIAGPRGDEALLAFAEEFSVLAPVSLSEA
jgi:hypothetical protein